MTEPVEQRTFDIHAIHGRYRITIPATWKITFGAIVPGKSGGSSSGSYGIRVWEAAEKQRLVMDGVMWFRDISIPMQKIGVRKFGDDQWHEEPFGLTASGLQKFNETVERQWIDIDLIKEGPPPGDEPETAEPDEWGTPVTRMRSKSR